VETTEPALKQMTRRKDMEKMETVALMAATLYTAEAAGAATTSAEMYERAAEQAWALYDAVETEAGKRHSRR
jgi:hypothetical protein